MVFPNEYALLPLAQHHKNLILILSYGKSYEDLFTNHDFPLFTKPFEFVGLCMRYDGYPSFSTILVLAKLAQLPPSIIMEHNLLLIR